MVRQWRRSVGGLFACCCLVCVASLVTLPEIAAADQGNDVQFVADCVNPTKSPTKIRLDCSNSAGAYIDGLEFLPTNYKRSALYRVQYHGPGFSDPSKPFTMRYWGQFYDPIPCEGRAGIMVYSKLVLIYKNRKDMRYIKEFDLPRCEVTQPK